MQLHLPRRRGGRALHRGADPRPSPRRAGAGADRRHRRRLFLVGHLQAPARAPACRSTVSCIRTCRGSTPFLNLRNHRKVLVVDGRIAFTGGINIGAREHAGRQSAAPGARHAFPPRWPGRRAARRGLRRRLAVRDRRETAGRRLVPAARSRPARRRPRRHLGPDEDLEQIEFVALHAISCARQLDPRGDALLPAARHR